MARLHTDERGATAVLVGVLLPVLLAFSALGVGTLALSGAKQELQRAADAGALSAAARLPVVDTNEAPGLSDLKPGLGLITGEKSDVCEIVHDNLASAAMTDAFGANTACSVEVLPFGYQLSDALQAGLDVLPNHRGNLHPFLRNVDIPALLPGVARPYVEMTVTSDLDPPLRGLVSPGEPVGLEASAVARRRVKNAVLVPATDASVLCETELLGTGTLGDILANLTLADTVNDCWFDLNKTLEIPRDPLLTALDDVATVMEDTDELALAAPAVRELRLDVADVYNPPTGGDVPSQWDLIEAAAADDEDVLVILANPIPGGGGLLETLIGASAVPILDVAAVPARCLADGQLSVEHMNPLDEPIDETNDTDCLTALHQGRGLFRATLVEEGPTS